MTITQTPLRVSFFGGGSDLPAFYERHGGAVLSSTIDKYVYIIVKSRYDDRIVLNYSERETVDRPDDIRHKIFREAIRLVGLDHGVEITSIADIPSEGSGLGSSSAFAVGLLNALYNHVGDPRNGRELAEAACYLEISVLGEPIGKQDQYASAFGGFRRYTFPVHGEVGVESVNVSHAAKVELDRCCLMFYTGITRKASTILGRQRAAIDTNEQDLMFLRDKALEGAWLFEGPNINALGAALDESWKTKRRLTQGISIPEVDQAYEMAMNSGALGGKLLGAGGGGFLLLICPPEKQAAVREALTTFRELPFQFVQRGSRVVFSIDETTSRL